MGTQMVEQPIDTRPAIRWISYMGGREEMESVYLIGPYQSAAARDQDLRRLRSLPLGAPEYHGGQEFMAAAMADAGTDAWFDRTVEPAQIAAVTTQRGFHAAFNGDEPPRADPDDTPDDDPERATGGAWP